MLPIPARIGSGFGGPAEDALYNIYHQMGGKTPGVTPEKLIISVALKIEHWLKSGIRLNLNNIDTTVFAVLSGTEKSNKDSLGTWRMAKTIARLGVIQALLIPEISKHNISLQTQEKHSHSTH